MQKYSIFVLLTALLFICSSCFNKKEEEFRVLVIHSYEKSYSSYPDFNKLISSEFVKRGVKANIHTFYLDCELYQDGPELARISSMLDSLTSWRPDIILVNEDQATYSLLKCGNSLAKEVPIVFAGVNYPNWALIKKYPNVTGFHDKIDFKNNVRMIQHFYGKEIQFATILDSTFLDRQIMNDARLQLKDTEVMAFVDAKTRAKYEQLQHGRNSFLGSIHVRGFSQKELSVRLSQYAYTRCLLQLKRDFTTINIGNLTPSPCFAAINEGFGYGEKLLGGYLTPLPIQVEEEVQVAVRILRGEKPALIPISESRKQYVMDWDAMQALGIPKEKVPADFDIIHIPFSERYREWWLLLIIVSVAISATLLVALVFLYRREQARRQRALSELADEKESLALAIQGSDTFAWKVKDGFICFEEAFWEAVGISARTLDVEEITSFIHPTQRDEFERAWEKRMEEGKSTMQLQLDFNGKGYQWWEFRYSIFFTNAGVARVTGLLLNIQSFKEREQELEEARALAEKAELKQSFLANMSHEIRTPLNSIVGFSNILASGMELEPEEKLEYIETINRNSDLLLKLVNDILELSRIESGFMSFVYEECIATDIVNEVFSTHQLLVPSRLSFLKENSEVAANIMIRVDKGRLTQVVTNFMNNAIKFTQEGYIKVGCQWVEEKHEVRFFVEDTGMGIPKEEQQMIFSRFYKQDEFAQGTGLGLSICQVIIGKLGGRIEVWSELGKGSCFTVIVPGTLIF